MSRRIVTVLIERVPAPVTERQLRVIELLESGLTTPETAAALDVGENTVHWHIKEAAKVVPGDLAAAARLIAWYRGAPLYVLERLADTQARELRAAVTVYNRDTTVTKSNGKSPE